MYLPFTTGLPVILSYLVTETAADPVCGTGTLNPDRYAWKGAGNCALNKRNVYFCGSSGASVGIYFTQPIHLHTLY
ncbi:hypothetical protein Vi05172_g13489 [Venturia inaequalis]|nr:hypothetical protein Vi05172_g13489 [Venturia inaequalis]